MEQLTAFFTAINDFVWGPPMLVLILGTGLLLQLRLKLMPILRIGTGFRMVWKGRKPGRRRRGRDQPLRRADDRAGRHRRHRQHRRRRHRDRHRRAGRAVLDVDDRAGRHGHQVRRGAARGALPRDRRPRRAGRRPDVRDQERARPPLALARRGVRALRRPRRLRHRQHGAVELASPTCSNASFGVSPWVLGRRADGADRLRAARRHQAHRRGGREAGAVHVHRLRRRRR